MIGGGSSKENGRLKFGDFDTNLVLAGSTTKRHTFDFFEILLITSNWHKILSKSG